MSCVDAQTLSNDYQIHRLRPSDAPGVLECVRQIYGESYVHPDLYHPEELLRLNASGELISVVACDAAERVVGHYALERPGLGPIAEGGEAMVLPECRHHQLMERMHAALEEEAARIKLAGIFGHAVTNHVFTQRSDEHFHEFVCAWSLGWSPRTFHNMPEPLPQRMSDILYFKYLDSPDRVRACLPAAHEAMLRELYERLQVEVEHIASQSPTGEGSLVEDYRADLQRAVFRVQRVGKDSVARIAAARQSRLKEGLEAVFVELPLSQPGTAKVCERLESQGFFFSGLGPCFATDGDALRLQWLRDPLDPALLQIETPFARRLLDYALAEQQRTRAIAAGV